MQTSADIITLEYKEETAIVIPKSDLLEIHYERIATGTLETLEQLKSLRIKNIVLDLHNTNHHGSTALSFFVKLWNHVRSQKGQMALCCVSPQEREVLAISKFDTIWNIYATRAEALEFVNSATPNATGNSNSD